jgi:hypothetical protein
MPHVEAYVVPHVEGRQSYRRYCGHRYVRMTPIPAGSAVVNAIGPIRQLVRGEYEAQPRWRERQKIGEHKG